MDQLPSLTQFASFHVVGMGGAVPSGYVRAKQLKLGPLILEGPLFMKMSIQGLVPDPPGPIVGILGCVRETLACICACKRARVIQRVQLARHWQ